MKLASGLLAGIVLIAASIAPRVPRSQLVPLERLNDSKVIQLDRSNPGEVLARTQGVYLDGYGAVFTAEVDLNPYAAPNPFRPQYSDADLNKVRDEKMNRVSVLKKRMVESLVAISQNLERVPANERVAMAVTIPYYVWEKSAGMPRQIVIHAPKSALQSGGAKLESALTVQEF
jgi:hypothetical protein